MIDEFSLDELRDIAVPLLEEAREMALKPEKLEISAKTDRNDLVTQVDREIEDFLAQKLVGATKYPMLGEESHEPESFAGRVWVLDPIDGTMNYVATKRDYAISLALVEDGQPLLGIVVDVTKNLFYVAQKGCGVTCNGEPLLDVPQEVSYSDAIIITDLKEMRALPRLQDALVKSRGHRRYGSAALEIVEVACSRAGAFVHLWVSPWDIAAATLVCQELGVKVTRLDGTRLDVREKGSILAAWPKAHEEMLHDLIISPR